MKTLKISFCVLMVAAIIFTTSCKKYLDVNTNPNAPSTVTPRALLPGSEMSLAYTYGGDIERYAGIMTQYITGGSRQFFGYGRYIFSEEDFNNLWNNMYPGCMQDYHDIMKYAAAQKGSYTAYDGVAHILMAYALGLCTDMYGDVPYDDAFKGIDQLHPAYMTQDKVYDRIQSLLTEGIDSLTAEQANGDDIDAPSNDDLIYGGDYQAWINLAHALKARYFIHLTDVSATAAADALAEITAGGLITDAMVPFSTTNMNPWAQYIENRDDISYSGAEWIPTYAPDMMLANLDPRYAAVIDEDGNYYGAGYLGPFICAEDAPVYLMTEFERQYIAAEANERTGNAVAAQTAFTAAMTGSFSFYGVTDTSNFQTTYGTLNAAMDTAISQIITDKYYANYLSFESWNDWRRTGWPMLTVNPGVLSEIPRRFIYPTNENIYNSSNCPQGSTLLAPKLWWDN